VANYNEVLNDIWGGIKKNMTAASLIISSLVSRGGIETTKYPMTIVASRPELHKRNSGIDTDRCAITV
jgi:hypothetical protein